MVDTAFDTHRAVKTLQAAGIATFQAEAVVDAIANANGARQDYATKEQIAAVEKALEEMARKDDLAAVEKALGGRLDGLKTDAAALKTDVETLKSEMGALKISIETTGKSLNTRIDDVAKYLEQSMRNHQPRTMLWGVTTIVTVAAWVTFLDKIRAVLGI